LAVKFKIDVGAGVIDSDYRGEGNYYINNELICVVCVLLFNFSDEPFASKFHLFYSY